MSAAKPNWLRIGDLSYQRYWEGIVSFAIDVYDRGRGRIVSWRLAAHMRTDLVLDALRVALGTRQP